MTKYLGEFEYTVLVTLLRMGGTGGGKDVHDEIRRTSGRDTSIPAVYVTLKRMAQKGYVDAERGGVISQSVGRGIKTYAITDAGAQAVLRSRDHFDRLWAGVDLKEVRGV